MYDKLSIPARERSSWECIDLGIASAREHYWVLFVLFLVPCSLIALASYWAFPEYQAWLPMLLAWWFKPLYERPILYYLSRTMFGENMTIKMVITALPSLRKPGLLSSLTYSRLSPGRSLYMPIFVLEKQIGGAYRQRRDLLNYNQSAHNWLTILGIHIETVLQLSAFLLFYSLIPESVFVGDLLEFMDDDFGTVLNQALWILAMSLFAPFYVAAGFMLYINRRIKLEGWDIEINFHNIVNRLHKERKRSTAKPSSQSKGVISNTLTKTGCFLLLTLCMCNLHETSLHAEIAQENSTHSGELISQSEAYDRIYQIQKSEEIVEKETKTGWRFKQEESELKEQNDWFGISSLEGLSKILRFIAIVVMVSVLIYLVYFYRDIFARIKKKEIAVFDYHSELTPIAKRLKGIPDDFITAAQQAWDTGDHRLGMSLLYRGSLLRLVKKGCKEILIASTENECLTHLRTFKAGEHYDNMHLITRSWQQTAYAQRTISEATFQSLINSIQNGPLTQADDADQQVVTIT